MSSPDQELLVRVNGVSKKFCRDLKKSLWYGLKDVASELLPISKDKAPEAKRGEPLLRPGEFWANQDISFELRRGECLGLIGRNGAGKTTLLKMLNGLIKPDAGSIEMRGRVGALIALGAGFNPILTGRENIYVNGSILGLSNEEINRQIEEIIEFAEIREFIDSPVQSYSSGMQVRLGFAVATALSPDILIIDEALAVGDVQFKTKCYNRLAKLRRNTAIIFVSHQRSELYRICDLGLVLNHGKSTDVKPLGEALRDYDQLNLSGMSKGADHINHGIDVAELRIDKREIEWGEDVVLHALIHSDRKLDEVHNRVSILDPAMNCVAEFNSLNHGGPAMLVEGPNRVRLDLKGLKLASGTYSLNYILSEPKSNSYIVLRFAFADLTVRGNRLGLSTYQI